MFSRSCLQPIGWSTEMIGFHGASRDFYDRLPLQKGLLKGLTISFLLPFWLSRVKLMNYSFNSYPLPVVSSRRYEILRMIHAGWTIIYPFHHLLRSEHSMERARLHFQSILLSHFLASHGNSLQWIFSYMNLLDSWQEMFVWRFFGLKMNFTNWNPRIRRPDSKRNPVFEKRLFVVYPFDVLDAKSRNCEQALL